MVVYGWFSIELPLCRFVCFQCSGPTRRLTWVRNCSLVGATADLSSAFIQIYHNYLNIYPDQSQGQLIILVGGSDVSHIWFFATKSVDQSGPPVSQSVPHVQAMQIKQSGRNANRSIFPKSISQLTPRRANMQTNDVAAVRAKIIPNPLQRRRHRLRPSAAQAKS